MCNTLVNGNSSLSIALMFSALKDDLLQVQLQNEGRMRLMGYSPRAEGLADVLTKTLKAGGVMALWKGNRNYLSSKKRN